MVDTDSLETDYLVIGAGAAGMAIADALLEYSDATVTIVDRRHAPGGHWIDAYPYVSLHQPSVYYGVSSVPLGSDALDVTGTNAGFYELAGADELRAYYANVMHRKFLSSGRVQYFPNCDYLGEHRFASRLAQKSWNVHVRRKLIDTTYLEGTIPATSAPPFEVADGVRCVPAGEIVCAVPGAGSYVIIGAGKTALDACVWLLEQGVPASAIRWIKPREAWWINRRFQQPYTLFPESYRGVALQLEAMAEASTVDDLFARLEAQEFFVRLDPAVSPTMFRGAVISEAEISLLRQIEDVVRLGHVRRIERTEIILDEGRVPTNDRTVHVHCAARGLSRQPSRAIFEPGRMTVQLFRWGFVSYQFAALGVAEATIESDEEKNKLFPPIVYWDSNADFLRTFLPTLTQRWNGHPSLSSWFKMTRLNPLGELAQHAGNPEVAASSERVKRYAPAAVGNLVKLLG